jgi:membrane protein
MLGGDILAAGDNAARPNRRGTQEQQFMVAPGQRPETEPAPESRSARYREETENRLTLMGRLFGSLIDLPPVRRARAIFAIYNDAGGSLLAEGLAYSALFAGLTGLLFCVGVLGYLIPAPSDRQRLLDDFTGQLAPLAPIARDGFASVAAHAGAFSIVGLGGMVWGTSHFYGALDEAIARVFARTPARGAFDRILRSFVSVLLLVGGLVSGIAIYAIQVSVTTGLTAGPQGDAGRALAPVTFPLITAIVVVTAVGVMYRVVPNTDVPISILWLPALVAGLILTGLTELLVYIAPLLTGALSVFGGVAAVFAALAWLHLAFQVLMVGASWTCLRLDEATARARPLSARPSSPNGDPG